jgi:hypothetical protein
MTFPSVNRHNVNFDTSSHRIGQNHASNKNSANAKQGATRKQMVRDERENHDESSWPMRAKEGVGPGWVLRLFRKKSVLSHSREMDPAMLKNALRGRRAYVDAHVMIRS